MFKVCSESDSLRVCALLVELFVADDLVPCESELKLGDVSLAAGDRERER